MEFRRNVESNLEIWGSFSIAKAGELLEGNLFSDMLICLCWPLSAYAS